MNHETKRTLTIAINGQLAIGRAELEHLFRELISTEANRPGVMNTGLLAAGKGARAGLPRLAYTMRETAEVLGVHYQTVYRLLKRGLLRSSGALRHKRIAKAEIEWFLKETSQSIF